jgi:hypothetical protein
MVVDLIEICDLGAPAIFSAIAKVYLPTNFRVILTVLGDGTTFGAEQEDFPEDDLMRWPDVTTLMCHEKRGGTCHLETSG